MPVSLFAKKSIIYTLIALFMVNPLFSIIDFSKAKAADALTDEETEGDGSNALASIPGQSAFTYSSKVAYTTTCPAYKRPSDSAAFIELTALMQRYNSAESLLTMGDIFSAPKDAPIILSTSDRKAVKALYCASKVVPNYAEAPDLLYKDSTTDTINAINAAVAAETATATPKFNNPVSYLWYLKLGIGLGGQVADAETKIKNANLFAEMVKTAEKRIDNDKIERIWREIANKILNMKQDDPLPVDLDTLACVLQEESNMVRGNLSGQLGRIDIAKKIDGDGDPEQGILNRGLVDIRVIKTLLYLVTPKNEGGAGHWRIKVRRILQNNDLSQESNATLDTLNSTPRSTTSTATCEDGMTAAECGSLQNDQPDAEVTEQNGDEYEVWLNDLQRKEDQYIEETEKNVSAHFTGQAIDISEVDDIRCTLVKKRHLGGDSKTKKPVRPIKLAWQTTDGWDKSGENSDIDMMSIMRDAASDTVSEMLTALNGDEAIDYQGDLSRASLEDIIMLLGQSLIGYAVGTSNYALQGYDLNETLQNLGSVYLADYLGLPREIFVGQGFKDVNAIKYNIGRAAIEKRLGLPYGSLESFNVLDSKRLIIDPNDLNSVIMNNQNVHNLEGTLINIGQRKVEYEMGLKSGDLDDLVHDGEIGGDSLNFLVGRRVIENDLNLKKDSWPTTAVGYGDLSQSLGSVRTEMIRLNPGYIDSLLHLPAGTTNSFIRGEGEVADSNDFARKVGEIRVTDTTAGLKYFALSNTLYQLPGPDKDHPEVPDTWALALTGNKDGLITVGVHTLARLLVGDNRNQTAPKLGDGETLTKILVNEDGAVGKEIRTDEFALYAVRQWLRAGITRPEGDACQKPDPATSLNVRVDENGRTIYTGDLSMPQAVENQPSRLCILSQAVSYNITYTDKSGNALTADRTETLTISGEDSKANVRLTSLSIGLEDLDLFRLFGYDKADGRTVYQTIGAKLLYYGLANKALGKDSRAKIDLLEVNPQLVLKSSEIAFYVSRILRVVELTKQISDEWGLVQKDLPSTEEITDKINRIQEDLRKIYAEADSDIDKYQKITSAVSEILLIVDDLRQNLAVLQQYVAMESTPAMRAKLGQVNKLIIDINELIKNASEIIAGKEISSSDTLTLEQIRLGANSAANLTDAGNGRRTATQLSPIVLAGLFFGVLAGTIRPIDMLVEIGAGTVEANLGLPANSIIYLLKNYMDRGIEGKEALFQAIGQARIEEQFKMPRFYFQGADIDEPDFNNDYAALQKWLPEYKDVPVSAFYKSIWQMRFAHPWYGGEKIFQDTMVKPARANFWAEQKKLYGRAKILESTMDDIVTNIDKRGLNEASRSPENDLLFRFGLPMGQYAALKESSGNSGAWVASATRAKAIDDVFDIPENSTKSAFTGQKDLASSSLSNKEKNLLQASRLGSNISENMWQKYVQILNHELLPGEADQYGNGMTPDYIFNNPYAEQAAASENDCPIIYNPTADQKFMVNETTLGNNSFCYYDKTGRHCFESWDEAQRYANDHAADKITDTLGTIALHLTDLYNTSPLFMSKLAVEDVINGLTTFVNDRSAISIFNATTMAIIKSDAIAQGQPGGMPDTFYIEYALRVIAISAGNEALKSTLINLFTRKNLDAPIIAYKEIIGQKEAEKILTYRLFDGLGLDINPDLFDAGDFYDILTGDYSSLFRLGTSFIDRALDLPPGTTLLIYTALTPANRKCALDQIGGTLLGGLVGLNYVPISGHSINDFMGNIGQAKIEETLNLPRGTFRGTTIEQLIDTLRPINFTLAFKIPIDGFLPPDTSELKTALLDIMGADQYSRIEKSSAFYQIKMAKKYLDGAPVLSAKAYAGMTELDRILRVADLSILTTLGSTDLDMVLQMPGPDEMTYYQIYHKELNDFFNNMLFMDGIFGLTRGDTYLMLTSRLTPDAYKNKVGDALVTQIGLRLIATQIFGLEGGQVDAAIDLAKNLKNIFKCRGRMVGDTCIHGMGETDEYYHKWGLLYHQLDQIFGFQLDDKLNLPQGTIQKVLDDPSRAFSLLIEIGASKLDNQLGLDSSKVTSVTGLTEFLFPSDPAVQTTSKFCHAQAYGTTSYDNELGGKIAVAESDLRTCNLNGGDCSSQQRALNLLRQEQSGRDAAEQECIRTERAKQIAADREAIRKVCDESGQSYGECATAYSDTYGERLWEWAQAVVVEKINEAIADIKIKIGEECRDTPYGKVCEDIMADVGLDMPVEHIKAIVFHGDLKYLQVAALALAANVAMIKITEFLNCPAEESYGDECRQPLPPEFQITYEDLQLAIIGPDPRAYDEVAVWMTDNDQTTADFNADNVTHGLPPGSGAGVMDGATNGSPSPDLSTQEEIDRDYHEGYGMPAEYDPAGKVDAWRAAVEAAEPGCQLSTDGTSFTECMDRATNGAATKLYNYEKNQKDIIAQTKKRAFDGLKWKLMDAALWKMDPNVFPGFSEIMMSGTTPQRWAALCKYLGNGLRNGQIFGMHFELGSSIPLIWTTAQYIWEKYLQPDQTIADGAFAKFIDNTGYKMLGDFIAANSEDWFGFKINTEMAQGIVTGLATGDWGISGALSLDGVLGGTNTHEITVGSKKMELPTLGGAIVNYGVSLIFGWADKLLGLPAGTTYKVAKMAYDIYTAWKAYKVAEAAYLAGTIGYAQVVTKLEAWNAAKGLLLQFAIDLMVEKLLGKMIGQLEAALEIPAGALLSLISLAIYNFVAPMFGLNAVAPWMWQLAAVIFVLQFFFGYYRVEYWCTADGYYPKIGHADYNNDISGLGVWGGNVANSERINKVMKENMIASAQYKAKRLIGDMLTMQYSTKYRDSNNEPIIPMQMMTGRGEDPKYWNNLITTNLCQKIMGEDSSAIYQDGRSVCDGDTYDGVWVNPQTVAWTHIGF